MNAVKASSLVGASCLFAAIMSTTHSFSQNPQTDNLLPELYGVRFEGSTVKIDVVSYGQTGASDFAVQLDPASLNSYRLAIVRRREDRGRVAPHIIGLTLEIPRIDKLAQAKFTLENKLATTGDPSDPRSLLRSDP